MRFTQRASLLGVVALCFYLVAVVNSLPSFYYVLVWLAVGLLAACLGIALLSLTGTTCLLRERRPYGYARGEIEGNEAPPLWEASFGNAGSLNKTGLGLEFRLRRQDEGGHPRKKNSLRTARFLVEALPAGVKLDAPLALDFLPRGVYGLEGARLIGSDVLGLFRASKRLSLPEIPLQVVVAPPVLPLALRNDFARGIGGREGPLSMSRLGAGDDLRGVRTYVPGDDWRHVHWATTARTGELSVREFERNGRDAVLVIWDGALAAAPTRGSQTPTEEELSLVTSLLVAIDGRRTPVSLMILGGEEEKISAAGQDGLLSRAALEVLARAQPERTRPLATAFTGVQGVEEGMGQVFLVSSSLQNDLVECVSMLTARGSSPVVALCELRPLNTLLRLPRQGRATPASAFDVQEKALHAAGARVVPILLGEEATPVVLERALIELLEQA